MLARASSLEGAAAAIARPGTKAETRAKARAGAWEDERIMLAVIGAGSIGGYVAWQLERAGHPVVLGVRSRFERLEVEDERGVHFAEARVLAAPSELDPVDWIVLATKAHQTGAAADWLAAGCGKQTRGVVVLQNGVEHVERVAPFVGKVPVLPAIVSIGAEATAPGRIRHHAYSSLELAEGPLEREFASLFAGSDLAVRCLADFRTAAWRKLISNVTASPLTALTARRIEVMADPAVRELAIGLARECIEVARAEGADLATTSAESFVEGMASNAASWPPFGSSMLYDRQAGRPTEHEALTGAVVRIGARHGVPTPLNAAILALLRAAAPL